MDPDKHSHIKEVIVTRIHRYETRRRRIGYISYASLSSIALATIVTSVGSAYDTLNSAELSSYWSLVLTDTADLASTWSDVTLSIINSLPLGELTLISGGATIALYGCDRIYRFVRKARTPLYQFSITQ